MMLENFIYDFNLVTTLTVKDDIELCYVLNDRDKELDYSSSINLYSFVESFNKLYLFFRKDYTNLKKLNLGDNIEILKFSGHEDNKGLVIYINKPNKEICEFDEIMLYLYENKGRIHSYLSNGLNFFEKGYYRKDLELDKQVVKGYLDFSQKYSLFIDSYNFLKNKFIFGNGTTLLFSKVNGDLLDNLLTFEITFGNAYFNSEDYINVVFNLGENMCIDYDASRVILGSIKQDNKKEIIDKLIHSLFINKAKLSTMYSSDTEKILIK